MDSIVGKYVAIRMIILAPDKDPEAFKSWMTNTFLDIMGIKFQPQLERIIFLEGNKIGRQSRETNGTRMDSTPAGANSDFAWITIWLSREANETAWKGTRDTTWYQREEPKGYWNQFLDWCYPREILADPPLMAPARPPHGPPYDYLGVSALLYDQQTQSPVMHVGKGAGCLVEGFVVLYDKNQNDWSF